MIPPEIMPRGAKAQQNNGIDRYREQKSDPAVRQIEGRYDHENQQRHKPHQCGRQCLDHIFVGFTLQGFFRHLRHGLLQRSGTSVPGKFIGIGQQLIDGDIQLFRQVHQRQHIRDGFSPFPFGHRLIGIVQLHRKSRLGQSGMLSMQRNVRADLTLQLLIVHMFPPAYR